MEFWKTVVGSPFTPASIYLRGAINNSDVGLGMAGQQFVLCECDGLCAFEASGSGVRVWVLGFRVSGLGFLAIIKSRFKKSSGLGLRETFPPADGAAKFTRM